MPWEKSPAEQVSLGTELCHLGGGVNDTGKVKLFLLPLQCINFFFSPAVLDSWTSIEALSSVADSQIYVLWGKIIETPIPTQFRCHSPSSLSGIPITHIVGLLSLVSIGVYK